jgi:hypothetical protein
MAPKVMDKPRLKPSRPDVWTSRAVTALGWASACLAPVIAVGAWLLMTDPALATDIAVSDDPWPLVEAIAEAISDLLQRVLTAF